MPCFFSNSACREPEWTALWCNFRSSRWGQGDHLPNFLYGFSSKAKGWWFSYSPVSLLNTHSAVYLYTNTGQTEKWHMGAFLYTYIIYIYIYNPEFKILTSSKTQNDKIHQKQINFKTVIFLFLARTFLGEFYYNDKFSIYSLNYCT